MYTLFYIAISAFFWSMLAIFMAILQKDYIDRPKYTGLETAFYYSSFVPGMGVRPHLGTGSSQIEYSLSDPSLYVQNLDLFLQGKHLLNTFFGITKMHDFIRIH